MQATKIMRLDIYELQQALCIDINKHENIINMNFLY